ncbi:cation:proton antiporter domain-containing protein [Streptomyces sp. NBC_00286]|uniref:cation:proton antiporter domain-containing protein n=1 Tax=Streptomyces sp. NBC_00286 TaxID=2975701 RepID=UPI002E2C849A|nr:cation:proton antiporter [Streptomyces sp. NBC_00286]
MEGTWSFGLAVLVVALAAMAAVASNRLSERSRIPAPAFFLVTAAVAVDLFPALRKLSMATVQDIVTVALVVLLFQGGMEIGWRRFRPEAGAILSIGVLGTFATAALVAGAAHLLLGLDWRPALLLGTALAPTDPAVVFSVLGRRTITGRPGVLLPGESGANDPVGIALIAGLLGTSAGSALDTAEHTALVFVQEMAIGAAMGAAGGWALKVVMRKVPLPAEGLYPLRTLAGAFTVYGLTTVAHGSGFLAVFVAGVLLGDVRAPYKKEIERFHTALGSLGEIVAFAVLGLTVPLWTFTAEGAWTDGLLLAVLLVFVARPIVMGVLLSRMRLRAGERVFLAFTGLKGAVPVLLGSYIVSSGVADADRLYDVVFVVVVFSVIVQGSLVPTVARLCRVPMRSVELEPWALGVRLRERPEGVARHVVEEGSAADGSSVGELDIGEDTWISLVVREGGLVPVSGSTRLRVGDEVLVLTGDDDEKCAGLFTTRRE